MMGMRDGIRFVVVGALLCACHIDDEELEEPAAHDAPADAALESDAPEGDGDGARSGTSFAAKVAAHTEAARVRAAEREAESAPAFEIDESLTEEERAVEAKRLFRDGVQAFDRGEYERAAELFEHAYAYVPDRHALVYNAARAHEHAGHCCRARELYQSFVDNEEDNPQADAMRERLESMDCDECE